jgi:hypothetical protein
MFDYVHQKLREAEGVGLTRKELANRIGKTPSRLSHILGSPGNWTLDTVSELLIGIASEEIVPQSRKLLGRPPSNFSSEVEVKPLDIEGSPRPPSASASVRRFELEPVQ